MIAAAAPSRPLSLTAAPLRSAAHPASAQPQARPFATIRQEANARLLEGSEDKGLRGALEFVALTLEIADRAARDTSGRCELILCPIQQPARGATQFRT